MCIAFSDVLPSGFVVVSLHWGTELSTRPTAAQIGLAHQIIDQGADVVLGHHPHVVQGIEAYKGKIIAYSLGNFIFSPGNDKGRQSVILVIDVKDNEIANIVIYPVYIEGKRPHLLGGKQGWDWLQEMAWRSQIFKTRFFIEPTKASVATTPTVSK